MYVMLSSTDSMEYYPNNVVNDFNVRLADTLLQNQDEKWMVGLVDMKLPPVTGEPQMVVVYCSLCDDSHIAGTMAPVLRSFMASNDESSSLQAVGNIIYVPVKTRNVRHVRVYIRGMGDTSPSFVDGPVHVTLHLTEIE